MKTSGIYIHIPFCAAKCIYCDFYSVAGQDGRIDDFVNSLVMEINNSDVDVTNWKFDTIFIGGGTPSLLNEIQLEKIVDTLSNIYDLSNIIEFTMEANPGEAPFKKLRDFRSLGINRLSMGVQSFKSNLLSFLSRIHSAGDTINTFKSARKAGFENINCDVIYNIPNQSLTDWKDDLQQLIELSPEHISAYSLTVEQNTPLFGLVNNNTVTMPDDEKHLEFNSIAYELLNKNDFIQHEISNYSKLGKECFHNLHYWDNDTYLGFGPSAHSFDGNRRWNNYSSIDKYISLINNNESPIEFFDESTEIDKINEIIGFGLRMAKGFEISRIPSKLKTKFQEQLKFSQIKYPGMIIEENNRIKLSQKGMAFADAIAVELLFS